MRRHLALPFGVAIAMTAMAAGSAAAAANPSTKERVDVVEQDLRDAQGHVAQMRDQVVALEKEVRELRASLALDQPGQRITPADLAARISSVETDLRVLFENQNETSRKIAAIGDKVDAAFRQVSALQATVEATAHAHVPAAGELPGEQGSGAGAATAPPGAGLASVEAAEVLTEDVSPREGSGGGAQRPLPGTRTAPLVDPEELYQSARADFGRGSYDLAESGFQQFLESFPDSDLADNALYWVGECRYGRGEHERAIEAFDAVVTRWREADKTPDAAYKKGLALLELNRTAEGIVQLQRVKDSWPDAPAGRLARGKLQSLGLL